MYTRIRKRTPYQSKYERIRIFYSGAEYKKGLEMTKTIDSLGTCFSGKAQYQNQREKQYDDLGLQKFPSNLRQK